MSHFFVLHIQFIHSMETFSDECGLVLVLCTYDFRIRLRIRVNVQRTSSQMKQQTQPKQNSLYVVYIVYFTNLTQIFCLRTYHVLERVTEHFQRRNSHSNKKKKRKPFCICFQGKREDKKKVKCVTENDKEIVKTVDCLYPVLLFPLTVGQNRKKNTE